MTMRTTLTRAARRAWADGQRTVGTEYVLEELLYRVDPTHVSGRRLVVATRERLRAPSAGTKRRGWRSRDAGEGRRAEDDLNDVGQTLREAQWVARRKSHMTYDHETLSWSGAVWSAASQALHLAGQRKLSYAHRFHLLEAILNDPTNRANELLAELNADPRWILDPQTTTYLDDNDVSIVLGAMGLNLVGALSRPAPTVGRLMNLMFRGFFVLKGATVPMVVAVQDEGVRQAVRLGDRQVGPVHLLLGISAIADQLDQWHWILSPRFALHSGAAELLRSAGLDYPTIVKAAIGKTDGTGPADRSRSWYRRAWNPSVGVDSTAVVAHARSIQQQLGHDHAGTDHMLYSLLTGTDSPAVRVLAAAGADVPALRSSLAQRLGVVNDN
jgi:hypothetical protein